MKKSNLLKGALICAVIALIASLFSMTAFAAEVTLKTSSTEAKNGESVFVSMDVISDPGVSNMDIALSYDSTVMKLKGVSGGSYTSVSLKGSGTESDPHVINVKSLSVGGLSMKRIFVMEMEIAPQAAAGTYYITPSVASASLSDGSSLTGSATAGVLLVSCPHTEKEWVDDIKATCSSSGVRHKECVVCRQKFELNSRVETGDHVYGSWTVLKEATCTSQGERTAVCTLCNYKATETIAKADHKASDWTTVKASTCTEAGEEVRVCIHCFETMEKREKPLEEHTYGSWTVIKASTYTETGLRERYCSVCYYRSTDIIPLLDPNHDHVFEGNEVIVKNATCTENGLKRVFCAVEGCVQYSEKEINAIGHVAGVEIVLKEATCTEEGAGETKCSTCGILLNSRAIPKKSHTYVRWERTTEPTCKTKGVDTCTCTVCGYYITRSVAIIDHIGGEWIETLAPTCTEEGKHEKRCTMCDKVVKEEAIKAKGHGDIEWVVEIEPTCTEQGKNIAKCLVCEGVVSEEASAAKGHSFGEWDYTPPTYTANGSNIRVCSVCSSKESIVVELHKITVDSLTAEIASGEGNEVTFNALDAVSKTPHNIMAIIGEELRIAYKDAVLVSMYDLSLTGERYGKVDLKVNLEETLKSYGDPKVYSVDKSGKLTEISSTLEGDILSFSKDEEGRIAVCAVERSFGSAVLHGNTDARTVLTAVIIFTVLLLAEGAAAFIIMKKRGKF